jgi:hypothetical protein
MSRAQLTSTVEQNSAGAAAPVVAGKNRIINGDMSIAQRGSSVTYSGTDAYGLDRWYLSGYGSGQSFVASQQTSTAPTGARYYQRIVQSSANSTNIFVLYNMETTDVIRFAGQTVTLSFQYRNVVNFTNTWSASAVYSTATDGNLKPANSPTTITSVSLTNSSSWTSKSITFSVPSTATSFAIQFGTTNSTVSGAQFEFANVQVEVGSVATPFTTASGTLQGELALCQRYYWQNVNSNAAIYGDYFAASGTYPTILIPFPVTMRTTPSVNLVGTFTYSFGSALGVNAIQPSYTYLNFTASGSGQRSYFQSSTNSGLTASAEL